MKQITYKKEYKIIDEDEDPGSRPELKHIRATITDKNFLKVIEQIEKEIYEVCGLPEHLLQGNKNVTSIEVEALCRQRKRENVHTLHTQVESDIPNS